MSLATRCPHCSTLFKVTSGQLQLHEGQVRCGNCQAVFSGIEHLTAPDTEAWQKLNLSPSGFELTPRLSADATSQAEGVFAARSKNRVLADFSQAGLHLRLASLGLLLLLALQAVWWSRLDLLAASPALASWINQSQQGMQRLFSNLATQALIVEGSGLQALDEHNLRVELTLRNQDILPARWPHLKVDLLDPQGLVLASKSLTPGDYQVRNQQAASQANLIPGNQTVEVLAYLNISTLNTQLPESAATGFRLELFDTSPGELQ